MPTYDNSICINFLSVRAFNAGAAAFRERKPPVLPGYFSIYSGPWLRGWYDAADETSAVTIETLPY
jgi:hypothetical protein